MVVRWSSAKDAPNLSKNFARINSEPSESLISITISGQTYANEGCFEGNNQSSLKYGMNLEKNLRISKISLDNGTVPNTVSYSREVFPNVISSIFEGFYDKKVKQDGNSTIDTVCLLNLKGELKQLKINGHKISDQKTISSKETDKILFKEHHSKRIELSNEFTTLHVGPFEYQLLFNCQQCRLCLQRPEIDDIYWALFVVHFKLPTASDARC